MSPPEDKKSLRSNMRSALKHRCISVTQVVLINASRAHPAKIKSIAMLKPSTILRHFWKHGKLRSLGSFLIPANLTTTVLVKGQK